MKQTRSKISATCIQPVDIYSIVCVIDGASMVIC